MTMREPVVAGMFYPGEAGECIREIEIYLSAVQLPKCLLSWWPALRRMR